MSIQGAGVSERQEDWTVESIFEDWIADKTLSRRKLSWLEADIQNFIDRSEFEPIFPTEAERWMKNELNNPKCKTVVQCMAYLVDLLKPKRAGLTRLEKITSFLRRNYPAYL